MLCLGVEANEAKFAALLQILAEYCGDLLSKA